VAVEVFANDGAATVASGGATTPVAGTVESWTLGSSTLPAVSSSATPPTWCYITDQANDAEKMLVTNISGSTATVTRGADGTTPIAHASGFTVNQVATRASLTALQSPAWLNAATWFGADPAGAADSTTAIQNALNAAGTGGVVYLPAGTYKLTAALTMTSGVTLRGAGPAATILYQTGTAANGITIAATTIANVTVRDLRLNGPNTGSGVGIAAAANGGANPVVQLLLDNLIVYQFGAHGLYLQNTIVSILSCIESVNNLGRGFWLNEGTSTSLISCYANTNPNERGYYLQSLLYSPVIGCASDGNAIGYELNGCDSVSVAGCGAEDTAAGSSGLDGSSFKLTGCTSTSVRNIRALNNAAVGCYFTSNSTQCSLDGFTETAAGGATASITVDAGCDVTLQNYVTATAQTLASGTTTILNSYGYTFLRTLEAGDPLVLDSGSDTSGVAAATSPSFSTNVAKQLDTTQDVMLYIAVQTSVNLTVAIGPTSTPATTVMPTKSYALGLISLRIPKAWWVVITGTIADLTITQIPC